MILTNLSVCMFTKLFIPDSTGFLNVCEKIISSLAGVLLLVMTHGGESRPLVQALVQVAVLQVLQPGLHPLAQRGHEGRPLWRY